VANSVLLGTGDPGPCAHPRDRGDPQGSGAADGEGRDAGGEGVAGRLGRMRRYLEDWTVDAN